MAYSYENIQFDQDEPVRIFIHRINYVQNHWHDALEILFVLAGEIQLGIQNQVHVLRREDLFLINPNEMHTTSARGENLVLALQVDKEWMSGRSELQQVRFACSSISVDQGSRLHLERIRNLLAQMTWVANNRSAYYSIKLQSYLHDLIYQLLLHFQSASPTSTATEQSEYMPRLSRIIHHIHENYAQNVTLQDLAEQEYLSISYLSRLFKKHIGTSFKEYIIRLRLEHAVKDLLQTEKSISQLSFDNGFPNTNSFLEAFKETYGEAPSVFRKHFLQTETSIRACRKNTDSYFDLGNIDTYASLYKYLNRAFAAGAQEPYGPRSRLDSVTISAASAGTRLMHSWKELLGIGKAKDLFLPHILQLLARVRQELQIRLIRFHGIFDDEMGVYDETHDGMPRFDFSLVDQALDALLALDLRPFLELGFMPEKLAAVPDTVFDVRPSRIGRPRDLSKWRALVAAFLAHCVDRYGLDEVSAWPCEIWNEPNITGVFWTSTQEEYHEFFLETHRAVRSVSDRIRIVGPAVCNMGNLATWMDGFLTFCRSEDCMPDEFSFHFYLHTGDLDDVRHSQQHGFQFIHLSGDADCFGKSRSVFMNTLAMHGCQEMRVHLSEWNASPAHTDLSRDTIFLSAYLAKNILEQMDTLSSFGFWTVSDWIEEHEIPAETFHGGLGLFTKNGIPKAGYHALRLLSRLGGERIAAGPGYFAARSGSTLQLLLYNYRHYDSPYCSMDHSSITATDRYRIFHNYADAEFRIVLTDLGAKTYEISDYVLNRETGSAFDAWVSMGAPEPLDEERIHYLQQTSEPGISVEHLLIEDRHELVRLLTPLEVRLIELRPMPVTPIQTEISRQ